MEAKTPKRVNSTGDTKYVQRVGDTSVSQYQSRTARGALNFVTVGDRARPGHCQCRNLSLVFFLFFLLVLVLDERER